MKRPTRLLTPVWLDGIVQHVYVENVCGSVPFIVLESDGLACRIKYGNLWSDK